MARPLELRIRSGIPPLNGVKPIREKSACFASAGPLMLRTHVRKDQGALTRRSLSCRDNASGDLPGLEVDRWGSAYQSPPADIWRAVRAGRPAARPSAVRDHSPSHGQWADGAWWERSADFGPFRSRS